MVEDDEEPESNVPYVVDENLEVSRSFLTG
jgi:hypothetical protein